LFAGDTPSGKAEWSVARALAGREPTRCGCFSDDPFAPLSVIRVTTNSVWVVGIYREFGATGHTDRVALKIVA
jgi:hypothetical protein